MDYGSAAYTRELVDCYMHARYQRLLEILRERKVSDIKAEGLLDDLKLNPP